MSSNGLTSFLFSTPEMANVFSPEAQLRAMTRFEWALSSALEANGLAEPGSGAALGKLLRSDFVDISLLLREARDAGNIAIPFVRQLTATVKAGNENAARSIHFGATSQDVLDTALVLQMKEALQLLNNAMDRLDAALVQQIKAHRDTVMLGRTWLQAGPPVTLGLKLAGVLSALRRSRKRIHEEAGRSLVLQFGGAVGTLAALGGAGEAVARKTASVLGLAEAELPWHSQRDRVAAVVQVLALVTGTLAKLGRDFAMLMQPEIAELAEGGAEGRGGSSTMPHKHNPVGSAALIAIHEKMPALCATMLHAMPQEHERGLGLWQSEWDTVPEAFRLTAAGISYATELVEGLKVNSDSMQKNLTATHGLPMAEAVSAALSSKIGRSEAHKLLRAATDRAAKGNASLEAVLNESPEVMAHLTEVEIKALLDPRNYLGSAQRFIDRVLGAKDAHR